MCHPGLTVNSPKSACSTTRGVRKGIVAAVVALMILSAAGCATTMTKPQQEAAWRTLARSVGMMAYVFSPEARTVISAYCLARSSDMEGTLKEIWCELNDMQAFAVVQAINDVVTLAEASIGDEFKDREALFRSILDAICMGSAAADLKN